MKPQTRAVAAMMSGGRTYIDKVMGYLPIAYWPLNEASGSTAVCRVNSAQNGTYSNVTLNQSVTDANGVSFVCPRFDGSNSLVNILTATLIAAFDGLSGSLAFWARVFNVGVWTDGTSRYMVMLYVDASNYIIPIRSVGDNELTHTYRAAGTSENIADNGGLSDTDWMHIVFTWDSSAKFTVYRNATQIGTPQAIAGSWSGGDFTIANIGGNNGPGNVFNGWIAHVAIFDEILDQVAVTNLYNI